MHRALPEVDLELRRIHPEILGEQDRVPERPHFPETFAFQERDEAVTRKGESLVLDHRIADQDRPLFDLIEIRFGCGAVRRATLELDVADGSEQSLARYLHDVG